MLCQSISCKNLCRFKYWFERIHLHSCGKLIFHPLSPVLYYEKISQNLAVFLEGDKVSAGNIAICPGLTQVEKSRDCGFSLPFPRIHVSSLNFQQKEEGTDQHSNAVLVKNHPTSGHT